MVNLVNKTQNDIELLTNVLVTKTFFERFLGLMGKSFLEKDHGLMIRPCNSVHCFFMRFSIDVLFVDVSGVVLYVCNNLKPGRLSPIVFNSAFVIEANAGVFSDVRVGDELIFGDDDVSKN